MRIAFTLAALLLFPALVMSGEKEGVYLKQMMIPRARELLLRIGQTNDLPSTTNDVRSYKVDFYDDGWLANMQLTNGWVIRFFTDQRETNDTASHLSGKMEETYFKETMIPLAQEFLQRIGMTNTLPLKTNQVLKYKVDYFSDRAGCLADMRLTNNCSISFLTEKGQSEVWTFHQHIKTYYALDNAPKEKIDAVKALNLKNKLNDKTALALAKKYFKLLGHKEENFHPAIFHQSYWVGKDDVWGNLPYYEIQWYRKDVNMADRNKGITTLPELSLTVSGVDSSLIYYSRSNLPLGSDF